MCSHLLSFGCKTAGDVLENFSPSYVAWPEPEHLLPSLSERLPHAGPFPSHLLFTPLRRYGLAIGARLALIVVLASCYPKARLSTVGVEQNFSPRLA